MKTYPKSVIAAYRERLQRVAEADTAYGKHCAEVELKTFRHRHGIAANARFVEAGSGAWQGLNPDQRRGLFPAMRAGLLLG